MSSSAPSCASAMPGTEAAASAAGPSLAGFASKPNRSTGRPLAASRSALTGVSSRLAAAICSLSDASSIGSVVWSAKATVHGVDCPVVGHSGWLPWCLVVRRTRFLPASRRSDSAMASRVCSGSIMASISPISRDRFALTVVAS